MAVTRHVHPTSPEKNTSTQTHSCEIQHYTIKCLRNQKTESSVREKRDVKERWRCHPMFRSTRPPASAQEKVLSEASPTTPERQKEGGESTTIFTFRQNIHYICNNKSSFFASSLKCILGLYSLCNTVVIMSLGLLFSIGGCYILLLLGLSND